LFCGKCSSSDISIDGGKQIQKKNIQEANGVYVWSELKDLSADLIRSFSTLHGSHL
jgi:hypothetical protein